MIAPIDDRHADIVTPRERARGLQAREPASDDHDAMTAGHPDLKVSDNRPLASPSRLFANPLRRDGHGFTPDEIADVESFAAERPPTPLREAPALASRLGLSRLLVKDESSRWGLNAFKITGVAYALERWRGPGGGAATPSRLICASAGNHGRAVARAARERGVPCQVFLPADALPSRVAAIRAEGADVVQIDGTYEDALARASHEARRAGAVLVSDTSELEEGATDRGDAEPGIPDLIVRGYSRVFAEAARQWQARPDVVIVQGGVGGLVAAAAGWMASMLPDAQLIAAEPEGAACLRASADAGRAVTLPSTQATAMVCLRCAKPSAAAWPFVAARVDAFVAVSDAEAAAAVRALAEEGIESGASGACGFAALTAIAPELRGRSAMVVVTEGP
jgi:diaminopropionate ammonia-lyase